MHWIDLGLSNDGQDMTMIPTYVTKVPNGTEEVRTPRLRSWAAELNPF